MILHTKTEQEILDCIEAQSAYCKKKGLPHFAPSDGVCWRCHRQIFQLYGHKGKDWEPKEITFGWRQTEAISSIEGEEYEYITGYTNEEAATELITGCPHCNRSYCD